MKLVDGPEPLLSCGVPDLQLDFGIVNEESDFAEIDANRRKKALGAELRRPRRKLEEEPEDYNQLDADHDAWHDDDLLICWSVGDIS